MSDRQRPRNLTSSFTATDPRQWKVVGGDRVGTCTFCGGGPTEAVVGCPDGDAPILWQVAVCGPCLADTVMTRFAAVKHQRIVALAKDMSAAEDAIVKLRDHARWNNRDPAELRAEELAIREKFGLLQDTPLHDTSRRGSATAAWSNRSARSAQRTSPFSDLRRSARPANGIWDYRFAQIAVVC